ncbi:DNA mismatch repair protein C-terminal, partial [Trinorchestia longiramus]
MTISVFLPRLSKGDLVNISSSKEASLKSKKKASTLPLYCRPTPDKLFILVNDRPVYHKELEKRVKLFFSSCHEKLERSCPIGVIIVQLPADTIDVNLEPSKDRVVISGEDVVLELLTEILTELYGPVNEALPRSLLEKQALQENIDQEFMNKENINSSPENSSPRSTDTTSSNFSASYVDGSFCNQTSASTNLGVRSSKITKQPAFSENVPGDLLPASNLTPDERNVLEEILSQDILAHDPGASNLVPASAPSLSEVPGSSFSNPVFLDEPIVCYQAQEGENISSLDKNEVLRRSSILALPIETTSAADEGSHDTEPPSALLRGVSGDINPVAWSKGQILGDSGANIQSVHVLSADPRGCRRGLSDDCSASPAKRLKISFDDFRSSCIESKPLHSPSGCLEPLKNEDLITVSNSEVPTPIANSTSVIPSTNSSNATHQIPSVQITSSDNITPVKSVKHSSNSTSDFSHLLSPNGDCLPSTYRQSPNSLHSSAVQQAISAAGPNRVLQLSPPPISEQERSLPRSTPILLSQLRSGHSRALNSYQARIGAAQDSTRLACGATDQTTSHLFSCPDTPTHLTPLDLWLDPMSTATFLSSVPSLSTYFPPPIRPH